MWFPIVTTRTANWSVPTRTKTTSRPPRLITADTGTVVERRAVVESDWYDNEPCLSNPDVLRIVTEQVLRDIENSPGRRNVSVSLSFNL